MDPKCLTITGLILDIVGVAIVWYFGWPQPQLEPGVGLALENGTPVGPNGETVADHNRKVERRRIWYKRFSIFGLLLLLTGFGLQLAAQFL
jgi:hypothetical protein